MPFYLEEILRTLIDRGVIQSMNGSWRVMPRSEMTSLGVPDTLQELILARCDQLEPVQRRALQVASVIGKDFSLHLLREVLPMDQGLDLQPIIDVLVEREFILPQVDANTIEYTFRHILMSDAKEILVERFLNGKELTCCVLGNSSLEALPVIEIVPNPKYSFFDYQAKYTPGATSEICPARISLGQTEEVQSCAMRAHRALQCRDWSRTDMIFVKAKCICSKRTPSRE